MIRQLRLQNWRSYEDITLNFDRGTTFIVAPNGIGKTSLMEAAAWSIFGEYSHRFGEAIRLGKASATATVELELPDRRVMKISRTLPKKPGSRRPSPTVSIDGARIDASQSIDELRKSYAADPTFLLRLTMPQGPIASESPSDLGLRDHLCRIFGIEGLIEAAANLDHRIKVQEKLVKTEKLAPPADAATISALRARLARIEAATSAADSALKQATSELNRAQEARHARSQLQDWQQRDAQSSYELARLAEADPSIQLDAEDPDSVPAALDAAMDAVQMEREAVRVRQATLKGQAAAIGQHAQALQNAPDDCPVCRRPLDTHTITSAQSAHAATLAEIDIETERLHSVEQTIVARQQYIRTLIERYRSIARPGPRPTPAAGISLTPGTKESVEELSRAQQRAMNELISLRTEQDSARHALEAAQANASAQDNLQMLYTEEATLRASRAAISTATTELLNSMIQPLTTDLSARWSTMFPGRGRLRTQSDGDITREINSESLPYSAFSTGERTGLSILIRLLLLEASTKSNFCWFDEPLEHLDPVSRRHVAEILARASSMGQLNQIVVSTYEEPLARRLQERDPDNVKLIYVRQNSDGC